MPFVPLGQPLALSIVSLCVLASVASAGGAGWDVSATSEGNPAPLSPEPLGAGGFTANRGQWPEEVRFHGHFGGTEVSVLADGLVVSPGGSVGTFEPLVLRFPSPAACVEGLEELPTRRNYFFGGISAADVPSFERVRLYEIAPGIDVELRAGEGGLSYDLHLAPHAELDAFLVEVRGAEGISIDSDGSLVIETLAGSLRQRIGDCWEGGTNSAPSRKAIDCDFRLLTNPVEGLTYGFRASGRTSSLPMVLDPELVYATYVGGQNKEEFASLTGGFDGFAVDAAGATYLCATSTCCTPTTKGPIQPLGPSAWVGKISPDGSTLEWATYLDGSLGDRAQGVAVGSDGSVTVVGSTGSTDFPVTAGAFQTTHGGGSDMFIARLDHGGSVLWSTFYGGPGGAGFFEEAVVVELFEDGDVLTAGPGTSGMTTSPGAFDPVFDPNDQVLLRISADGSTLVGSTYFHAGRILDAEIGPEEHVYICGDVLSTMGPIPTTPGAFQEDYGPGPGHQAYAAMLGPDLSEVLWCTYLGGLGGESAWGMTVDAAGAVYLGGVVDSNDFPTTPDAFQPSKSCIAGFVTKLLPWATDLVWSTYLGDFCSGGGYANDLVVDASGNVWAAGSANDPAWPTTPDAFQPTFVGIFPTSDVALSKFDAFGSSLLYSTYFGGKSTDYRTRICIDAVGRPKIAFFTLSTDIPVTSGAYDTTYDGGGDLAVAAFDLPLLPWRVLGGGLKGAKDVPNLAGKGELVPGTTTELRLRGAPPSTFGFLVAGFARIDLPFLGGTLVPAPELLEPIATDPLGRLDVAFPWPPLAAGTELHLQVWALDPGAPQGVTASNALTAIAR